MNGIATRLPIDLQRCRFLASEPLTTASTHLAAGDTGSCGARRVLSAAPRRGPRRCGYAPGPNAGPDPDASRRTAD